MRFLWVDDGNDPNFVKGDASGITGYFLPLGGSRTTRAALLAISDRGKANGVYVGAGWWNSLTPAQWVTRFTSLFKPVRVSTTRACVNLEEHDPARIVAILKGLRAAYPALGLSWALEGMQGGWARSIAADVNALNVRVVPEVFHDPMARIDLRASDPATFYTQVRASLRAETKVIGDLAGYNAVSLFHPAEWLPEGAEGYVFTQGRLP